MNSNICHDTLVGIPEYLHKHQDVLLSIAELPTFYIAKVRFSRFLSHPFWCKSHFFTKEKMNSNICHDTHVGIPEYLHRHQDVLLSIAELPTFYIAKLRFSRFLSHPFWYKSYFFHKRKDEFQNLPRYTCWHTRVPAQTPGRLALHRRTSYILHCKGAIFPIFAPSFLTQKSFFSQKKRWIPKSVTIHLLVYQSTFKNTRTSCSPSQNFLHFTLQICDFPDFWAIPFDTKFIFFTKEKMNSNICHDTLVGIPEYLHKHQDVLLSIAELPTFYIAKLRFSRFLSHPFLYKIHFFSQKKRWIRTSVTIHLLAYQSTFTNTRTCCSPSQNFLRFTLQKCDFPDFWAIPFGAKVIFSQKKRWIRTSVTIPMLAYQSTFTDTRTCCSPSQNFLRFTLQKCDFPDFWAIPFGAISHFFHKRKDEFEHLSRYPCWHTRVPSQTARTGCSPSQNFLRFTLQKCDFPDFWAIPFGAKVIFSQKKRWIRTFVTIPMLAYQSTFTNTRTCCSPSQNFLHFTLQSCDFPDFWAIPFDTKFIFFTKEKMNSNICHDTLVGIPEYLHKHQDVLLSIAELPTFYIAKSAIFPIFEPSLLVQKSFFSQKKRRIRTSVTIPKLAYQRTVTNTRTCFSPSQNFLHFTLQSCDFPDFWAIPFWYKSHFFHKRKDEFEHLSRYTSWHTRVPSQTPGRLALHRRTSYILHCKVAIFPIFEPSLLLQNSFFSQNKRWIRTSHAYTCWHSRFTFDKHQDVLLSIAELPTFYIAQVRFSRFLSHPFWCKSHFFHKRKDEFEHLSRYPNWHTREPSQTPGRVALHRRTSYILHCKVAIFPIFEPSFLIQNSFFSQKKRWIRTSVTIHFLAYQITFTNTRTSCSPSQNFLHFTLQSCDFPDFWAIPFVTKFIFFTK